MTPEKCHHGNPIIWFGLNLLKKPSIILIVLEKSCKSALLVELENISYCKQTRVQRREARPKAFYKRNKSAKTIRICQQLD
jgi:hypothetical protein